MKKIVLGVITILFAVIAQSQELPINEKTGKATFMEVIEMGNVTAKEAYDVAKKWSANQPFKVTDDVAGDKMFFKARHTVSYPAVKGGVSHDGTVEFTVQLFFKDGRFRYIMTDFIHSGKYGAGGEMENTKPACGYGKISERAWNMIRDQTYEKTTEMAESLKEAIKEFQNDPARSDDW